MSLVINYGLTWQTSLSHSPIVSQTILHNPELFLTLSKRLLFFSGGVCFVHFPSWSSREGLTQQKTEYKMSLWGLGQSTGLYLLKICFYSFVLLGQKQYLFHII